MAFFGVLIAFVGIYFLLVELMKIWFYRHHDQDFMVNTKERKSAKKEIFLLKANENKPSG